MSSTKEAISLLSRLPGADLHSLPLCDPTRSYHTPLKRDPPNASRPTKTVHFIHEQSQVKEARRSNSPAASRLSTTLPTSGGRLVLQSSGVQLSLCIKKADGIPLASKTWLQGRTRPWMELCSSANLFSRKYASLLYRTGGSKSHVWVDQQRGSSEQCWTQ